MKDGKLKISPFILSAALMLFAIAAELVYMGDFEYKFRTKRFERVLKAKEKIMENCFNGMQPILERGDPHGSESENNIFTIANQNSITILEYIGNRLRFWSGTDFDVPRVLVDSIYKKPFIFLQNGWFLTKSVQVRNEVIVGLLRIRNDYGFENDIISNGFVKHFGIPDNTGFSRDRNASEYQIFSSDGTFLFSLLYPEVKEKSYFIYIPLLLWGLAFLAILYLTRCLADYLVSRKREVSAVIASFIILSVIYFLVLIARKPAVVYQTELFSPFRYTMNYHHLDIYCC
jgi:hypothetical protein